MMRSFDDTVISGRNIQSMFTAIAPSYDFLNCLLSAGQDRYWRKRAVDRLAPKSNERILDVATGTGDIVIEIASRINSIQTLGIDFSHQMLELGQTKVEKKGYGGAVSFQIGSGECLPFADKIFDGVVCAFGIRNFSNIKLGLEEIYRILKPGGRVVILEFSKPNNSILSWFYYRYFYLILPKIGSLISGHDNAYSYLPESIAQFPIQEEFVSWIEDVGFQKVSFDKLTFGIASIHYGLKGTK